MKQVSYLGATDIGRHSSKPSRPGDLAPGICATHMQLTVLYQIHVRDREVFDLPINNNTFSGLLFQSKYIYDMTETFLTESVYYGPYLAVRQFFLFVYGQLTLFVA